MKKINYLVLVFLIVVTTDVKALSAVFSCTDEKLIINETFTCDLTINNVDNKELNSFKTNVSYPKEDLELISITPFNDFTSNSNDTIDLTYNKTEQDLTEKFKIASLKFKVKDTTTYGSKTISVNGIDLNTSSIDNVNVISTNNLLKSLSVSNNDISFDPNKNVYNIANVTSSSIVIRATLADERAHFDENHKPGVYDLKYGENKIQIVVVSESGKSNIYTLNITRSDKRSSNNNLSKFEISTGTLNPLFNKNTLVYDVAVTDNVEKISVTASLESDKAYFVTGYGPREVTLKEGINNILIQIKAEDGSAKTYTINVTKSNRSGNNYLKKINLSVGEIDFIKEKTEYKINVLYDVEEVNISAEAEDSKAKVEVVGNKKLVVGENTYKIKVTAENDFVKTYTIIITRLEKGTELSNNNYLKELEIKNYEINFNKDILEYELTIKNEDKLSINYQTDDENATVRVIGNKNLKDGSVVSVVVTSETGDVRTYEINIIKNNTGFIIIIVLIFLTLLALILGFIFKDKLFKKKEKEIHSDVLKDKKLILNDEKLEKYMDGKKLEINEDREKYLDEKINMKKNTNLEKTRIYVKKPELTVIPNIAEDNFDEFCITEIYGEKKQKSKKEKNIKE